MIAHKNKTGFTLIELLVVIAIIGMLSSIVLSSLRDARTKAEDAGKIRELQEVRTALQLYYTDNGYYPGFWDWKSVLIATKRIPSISNLIIYNGYKGSGSGVSSVCGTTTDDGGCPSYHIGVVLKQFNVVLNSDKDISVGFDGNGPDCAALNSANDRCYDLIP